MVVVAAAVSWARGTLWAARSTSVPGPRAATVLQLLVGGLVLLALGGILAPTEIRIRGANSYVRGGLERVAGEMLKGAGLLASFEGCGRFG
jgi:hypothetical protein